MPEQFRPLLDDPARYRLQILYSRIDRDEEGRAEFQDFGFRLDADEYFYPASTVKLPVALLALERLNSIGVIGLDADTPMFTDAQGPDQTAVTAHPRAPAGVPSVGHYVREIFAVSDNDAFNRLYEFLGQEPLNRVLQARGFAGTRILHRLSVPLTAQANAHTNPVRFVHGGRELYAQPAQHSELQLTREQPILLGNGELVDGQLVPGPKNFADKNSYPLAALHSTIRRLIFPESVPKSQRFELSPQDHAMVLRMMAESPRETGIAAWADAAEYPEGYVKFLLLGGHAPKLPEGIRIFNKVGEAYGFLTDSAYIVDFDAGAEFLLSATVYVNANGVFNDDVYEYDTLGFPFLAQLGAAVLAMERNRPKARVPDLSKLRDLFPDP